MAMTRGLLLAGFLMASTAVQAQEPWQVKQAWVSAHESFLAGEALQGRGSATRDEAIAAVGAAQIATITGAMTAAARAAGGHD